MHSLIEKAVSVCIVILAFLFLAAVIIIDQLILEPLMK